MKNSNQNIRLAFLLSISLGLAPLLPEPHIWGKIKWIAGGAIGMQPMDYFDVVLHGGPWVILFVLLISKALKRKEKRA